ncbi:MAG: V-type ATP synthase subunit E family protein [Spirochaetia bacterium]
MQEITPNTLLQEIEKRGQKEVDEIRANSEKKIAIKKLEDEKAHLAIIQEITLAKEKQIARLDRLMHSNLDLETRRIRLKEQTSLINCILLLVQKKMHAMIQVPGYTHTLLGWITEAALGIAGTQLIIRTSEEEAVLIDQELINHAIKNVAELAAGRVVSFKLDKKNYLLSQGIVVVSTENCLQFSNTLKDRLLRYDSQIRTYIFNHILGTIQ